MSQETLAGRAFQLETGLGGFSLMGVVTRSVLENREVCLELWRASLQIYIAMEAGSASCLCKTLSPLPYWQNPDLVEAANLPS